MSEAIPGLSPEIRNTSDLRVALEFCYESKVTP